VTAPPATVPSEVKDPFTPRRYDPREVKDPFSH
jgi:hypothetical protein